MEKSKHIFLILVIITVIVLSLSACGLGKDAKAYRDLEQIKQSKTVKIGVSSDNNPLGFAGEDGSYHGYEVYFAERLARDMGVNAEYVSVEAESRAKYLETGRVDVVIASYAVEKSAERFVDFAQPYMKTTLAAATSDKSKVKTLEELGKNDRVIVISGSKAAEYMAANYPQTVLLECGDVNEAVEALESRSGVIWLGKSTEVGEYAGQRDGYSVTEYEIGDPQEIAPAVTKGNSSLLKKINGIMKNLSKEGFFHTDYRATLNSVYGEDFEKSLLI